MKFITAISEENYWNLRLVTASCPRPQDNPLKQQKFHTRKNY